jgi:hypothetical protein
MICSSLLQVLSWIILHNFSKLIIEQLIIRLPGKYRYQLNDSFRMVIGSNFLMLNRWWKKMILLSDFAVYCRVWFFDHCLSILCHSRIISVFGSNSLKTDQAIGDNLVLRPLPVFRRGLSFAGCIRHEAAILLGQPYSFCRIRTTEVALLPQVPIIQQHTARGNIICMAFHHKLISGWFFSTIATC